MLEWMVSSTLLILAVAALRAVSKGRISFRMRYALWLLVLLRLLIPVNFGAAEWSAGNFTRRAAETEGVKLIAEAAQTTLPRRSYRAAYTEIAEEYAEKGVDISVLPVEEFETVDYEILARMGGEWTVRKILTAVRLLGAAAVGVILLAANIRFAVKLRRTRQELKASSALPVYLSPEAETPCLFGVLHPAVYVTPEAAADDAALRHVVAHELTHFRHGDHIWSLLRGVCLALHWYNPAVWWAASLSQRDAELACDEAAIERLGEDERAAYGRTLLQMTCEKRQTMLRLATTMTGSKNVIKERIVSIAKKPKPALLAVAAVLLLGALAVGCAFTGAAGEDEPPPAVGAGSEDVAPAETVPALSPEEEKAAAERLAAVQAAEKKLAGYRWPRETVQKTVGDREVEFVLYHGNGYTIDVPDGWTQPYFFNAWRSPSDNAGFTVSKWSLPVNNPKWYRAQSGSWRHETGYAPPFDYYYDDDGGYTPPEGNTDCVYFFAPAGERSYELELSTIVGQTTDEERAVQEAMLLSFAQDESSHALHTAEYKPGASEWDAAMAGLVAESERLWLSWYHYYQSIDTDGKQRPEYFSYARALTEFRPGEFTQTFFGERPEGADTLDREHITICLPGLWTWLYFYDGSPWAHISCAGEEYWTQLHRADAPEAFAFDAARAWVEAEQAWAKE